MTLVALAGVALRLPAVPIAARIVVGTPVPVSSDHPDMPHVEPFLAAHPSKPDLLFGAGVTFPAADPKLGIDISSGTGVRSLDAGRSWGRVALPGCRVDPWVSFGSGDDLYVACLGHDSSVLVLRSPDAGRTWAEAVPVPAGGGGGGGGDKPTVSVDRSTTARRGTVYVAFGQYFPTAGLRQRDTRKEGEPGELHALLNHNGSDQKARSASTLCPAVAARRGTCACSPPWPRAGCGGGEAGGGVGGICRTGGPCGTFEA